MTSRAALGWIFFATFGSVHALACAAHDETDATRVGVSEGANQGAGGADASAAGSSTVAAPTSPAPTNAPSPSPSTPPATTADASASPAPTAPAPTTPPTSTATTPPPPPPPPVPRGTCEADCYGQNVQPGQCQCGVKSSACGAGYTPTVTFCECNWLPIPGGASVCTTMACNFGSCPQPYPTQKFPLCECL